MQPKNSTIRRLKLMDAERQISRSGEKHPLEIRHSMVRKSLTNAEYDLDLTDQQVQH